MGAQRLRRSRRGRQHRAYRAFVGTRREAESALASFVAEVEGAHRVAPGRMTFGQYAKQWIASREAAGELASKTAPRYRGIIRDHLLPLLDNVELRRFSVSHVRQASGSWRSGKRCDRKKGALSEKSVHDHFALLKQIVGNAVRECLIRENPVEFVRAPGKGGSPRRTYTMTQVLGLVDYLEPTDLATPVFTKALTGLRRGELLALKWSNLDVATGELNVVESLERREDGSLHFKRPKTDKSLRLIVLPECVLEKLHDHRVRQQALFRQLQIRESSDLIFGSVDRSPWDPDAFSSAFAYQIAKSGLPRISLQELRHSYSSISQRTGTPLPTTSQTMG